MDGGGGLGSGPDLFARLERWAADARVAEAAAARSRERWLRQQAGEDATLAGTLVDLAERGAVVLVATSAGHRHRARVTAVGSDFFALAPEGGGTVLVATAALAAVTVADGAQGAPVASGDRTPTLGLGLATAMAGLAGERPAVVIAVAGQDESVVGELWAAGADVVTVRRSDRARSAVHVPVAAIAEVTLLDAV